MNKQNVEREIIRAVALKRLVILAAIRPYRGVPPGHLWVGIEEKPS